MSTEGSLLEQDPNNLEQHAVGAKLDLQKPTPLLCLTDFLPALKQLVGLPHDIFKPEMPLEKCCAAVVVDDLISSGQISSRTLLASMTVVQSQCTNMAIKTFNSESVSGIVSTFPEALLAMSALTAVGAKKYRPSGWKAVPDGVNRYSEACMRHFLRAHSETLDPDSGATHWCCVAWNSAAVLTLKSSSGITT